METELRQQKRTCRQQKRTKTNEGEKERKSLRSLTFYKRLFIFHT